MTNKYLTLKNIFFCGLTGWCMEICFTAIGSMTRGDLRLLGRTSIWMFPIYGMAAFIAPMYDKIQHFSVVLRGFIYAVCIMFGEYISGSLLKFFAVCPWDYSNSLLNINGLVRIDYLPFWFAAGLAFERLLCWQGTKKETSQI